MPGHFLSIYLIFLAHGSGQKGWSIEKSQVWLADRIPQHVCSGNLHSLSTKKQAKKAACVRGRSRNLPLNTASWRCDLMVLLPHRTTPGVPSASSHSHHAVCLQYIFWESLSLLKNTTMYRLPLILPGCLENAITPLEIKWAAAP